MEKMESGYLCEVLHYLLIDRLGTPLVKIPVDLVDVDHEAALDLLYALFKHCKCNEDWAAYAQYHNRLRYAQTPSISVPLGPLLQNNSPFNVKISWLSNRINGTQSPALYLLFSQFQAISS